MEEVRHFGGNLPARRPESRRDGRTRASSVGVARAVLSDDPSHHDRLPTHPSRLATAGRGFASHHAQGSPRPDSRRVRGWRGAGGRGRRAGRIRQRGTAGIATTRDRESFTRRRKPRERRPRPAGERGGDWTSVRGPGHELDGGDMDRHDRADRVRTGGHTEDDGGPRARAEPDGMADREPLRVSREHHRAAPRQADLLVFRDRLHLHPRRQLDQPLPGRRHNRLGPSDGPRILDRPAALPGRQRRSEPDAGDVAGLLRPAGSSGR